MIDLDALELLLQEATPGAWKIRRYTNGGGRVSDEATDTLLIADVYGEGNRELIVNLHDQAGALIVELRAARKVVKAAWECTFPRFHERSCRWPSPCNCNIGRLAQALEEERKARA